MPQQRRYYMAQWGRQERSEWTELVFASTAGAAEDITRCKRIVLKSAVVRAHTLQGYEIEQERLLL